MVHDAIKVLLDKEMIVAVKNDVDLMLNKQLMNGCRSARSFCCARF